MMREHVGREHVGIVEGRRGVTAACPALRVGSLRRVVVEVGCRWWSRGIGGVREGSVCRSVVETRAGMGERWSLE